LLPQSAPPSAGSTLPEALSRSFSVLRTFGLVEFVSPEKNEADNYGLPSITPETFHHLIGTAIRQKQQLALNAIGDGAIRQFLDALENFKKDRRRVRKLRIRLEHAQLVNPEDLPRLAEWGILAAVQPSALIDYEKDRNLLGEERANRCYPYRSILKAGIPLSFGSDVPGESHFKPLELVHLAVNRTNGESVSPLEALKAYTKGSAHAGSMASEIGTLTPGKLADRVVLSDDPTSCPHDRIKDIRVEMTITGGRIVFESDTRRYNR
jgi:predicted amidohydrolase YtcJ